MDQSHGDGTGAWEAGNFATEGWDHHFNGPGLAFDQGGSADNGYPNPNADFLASGSINPQLSGTGLQTGLYRQFGYPYNQGDVWPDHAPPAAAQYGQDSSLHHHQGYYADQRHPSDPNQTVDGRFALNIQQGNEFSAQLNNPTNQQATTHHGFGNDVANGRSSASDSYPQAALPQWQGQVPAGYGSGHQYENPLASSQAPSISAPASAGSPSPFFASHGPAIPTYQPEVHQQTPAGARPAHPQFAAPVGGQAQQSRSAIPQQQQGSVTSTPPAAGQPAAQSATQNVAPRQPPAQNAHQQAQQPASFHTAPHQVSQQAPQQAQPIAGQAGFIQQPISQPQPAHQVRASPEQNYAFGMKRGSTSEFQPGPVVAKKAKVTGPAAFSSVSQSAPLQPERVSGHICTINHEDAAVVAEALRRPGATWIGVSNLVIGPAPVKLQKGTPTKRYVLLSTKGGKDPLFPKLWRGWTPAESLGNHADAYQKATSDPDRQRADIRLELEMKRGQTEIPVDWWKKVLKDRLGKEPKKPNEPAEPGQTTIQAGEALRIHPSHAANPRVASDAFTDFYWLLHSKASAVKAAFQSPASKTKGRTQAGEATESDLAAAKEQLERAIEEGLRVGSSSVLAKLGGKNVLPAIFRNVLIRLINSGETNSSLAKAILRLYTRFANVDQEQLETWNMDKIRDRLKTQGDAEVKALIGLVYQIAEENSGDGSHSESDSTAAGSGGRAKKATRPQTLSKQAKPASDLKKPATGPSTSKPSTSTTNSKKISTTLSSKTMAPGVAANKLGAKTPQRMLSTTAGTKRSREEDVAGGDARSSKKPANNSGTSTAASNGIVKPTSSAAKPSTGAHAKASTTSGPAASQAKPRSGLLLPGKARPISKPVARPDFAQKGAAKPEPALKTQPTKVDTSRLPSAKAQAAKAQSSDAGKQSSSGKSFLSTLMDEIHEPKKASKPEVPVKAVTPPDPNETPQQRERRLRKEERRALGLKVTFRSGDRLTEIREFTRHPDEMAEGNTARSAKTDGRDKNNEEGQMMKRLHGGKGIKSQEINDREWEELTPINFATSIPQEKREQTYVTRGGLKPFETDEQKLIKERELNELMAIYHNPADIPPNPRSPPYEPSFSGSSGTAAGIHLSPATPGYDEMMQRNRECRQWGPYHASRAAQSRLDTKARPDYADFTKALHSISSIADSYGGRAAHQPEAPSQQPVQDPRTWFEPAAAARRDQQTFELLTSGRAKQWKDRGPHTTACSTAERRDTYADPKVQRALESIQAVVASLRVSQPDQAAQTTPAPQSMQHEVAQPAFTAEQGAQTAAPDYSAAWAQYYAAQQQQQQQAWYGQHQNPYAQAANPYAQPQAVQAAAQPEQQTTDLAGILAALGNQQAAAAAAAAAAAQPQHPSTADPNSQIQALMAALAAGGTSQGQPAAATAAAATAAATGAQATDPQSAQYLLDVMKWATAAQQNQGGGAQPLPATAAAAAAVTYPYGQTQAQGYGDTGYGGQGYNQPPTQERDAYGPAQAYSGGGGAQDSYGRDRDSRDRGDYQHHKSASKGGGGRNNSGGGGGGGGGGGSGSGSSNDNVPEHLRGINRSLIGTKQCSFWAKGQCAKGDKCTFRHD
ncbi:hypothetical protein BT67DRAFT_23274 [Trichocladium antarcticum]|uniref:C3H1-type domain-containing protein n=1 Tax=Trichocladium antarcticum TaxID=1450529 RepID=A0AAN6UTA6_9PEZI|nr:hypothetical protein BT67DRAFT_23274 [Trichocladium antarcticum]